MRTRGISPAVAAALLIVISIVVVLLLFASSRGLFKVGGSSASLEVVPSGTGSTSGQVAIIKVHVKNIGNSPAQIEEVQVLDKDGNQLQCSTTIEPSDIVGRVIGAKESADFIIRLTQCSGLYNGAQLIISVKYKDVNSNKEDYAEKMFKLG